MDLNEQTDVDVCRLYVIRLRRTENEHPQHSSRSKGYICAAEHRELPKNQTPRASVFPDYINLSPTLPNTRLYQASFSPYKTLRPSPVPVPPQCPEPSHHQEIRFPQRLRSFILCIHNILIHNKNYMYPSNERKSLSCGCQNLFPPSASDHELRTHRPLSAINQQ